MLAALSSCTPPPASRLQAKYTVDGVGAEVRKGPALHADAKVTMSVDCFVALAGAKDQTARAKEVLKVCCLPRARPSKSCGWMGACEQGKGGAESPRFDAAFAPVWQTYFSGRLKVEGNMGIALDFAEMADDVLRLSARGVHHGAA